MNLSFTLPWIFVLLPSALLPFVPRRSAALPFSSLEPLPQHTSWRLQLDRGRPFLAAAIILLLISALAGPTLEERVTESVRHGRNLILALDISASMAADDLAPSRMAVARQEAVRFINGRPDDRIGVVLFSGSPYLLTPPTLSRDLIRERLQKSEADKRGSGTAIGDALSVALARLKDTPPDSAAIILLTDGVSNRGQLTPTTAARAAAALGIRIYTIGFGTESGGEVNLRGQSLHVELDTQELLTVAAQTGGRYFRATSGEELEAVYRRIDALEATPLVTTDRIEREALTPPLVKLLLLLLLVEIFCLRCWLRSMP